MATHKDLDRLRVAIRNDLLSLIRKDSAAVINQVASDVGSMSESLGASEEHKVLRTEKGAILEMDVEVPTENAPEFLIQADKTIRGAFRFGKWSDMKVK